MKAVGRGLLSLIFIVAALFHVFLPQTLVAMTPSWVPSPRLAVIVTGLVEAAGGIGLMIPRVRAAAGIGLALYSVCVYPANIQHAVHDLSTGTGLGWAYHYPRLFAQPFICWWALWAGGLVGGRRRGR